MPRSGPTPETQRIGAVIRELRTARGMTTTELAAQIGSAQQTVSNWECGTNSPAIADLPRVADGLGISPITLAKKILQKMLCAD